MCRGCPRRPGEVGNKPCGRAPRQPRGNSSLGDRVDSATPCPPQTNGTLYLEGVVYVQDPAVQDGRTDRGDPQRPALPQRPPPRAHRLAHETGHHRSFLLVGAPSHEGLRLDHGCPRKHGARGAIVDLRENWDDLACGGVQWGASDSLSAALRSALFPISPRLPGTWGVTLSVDLGGEGDETTAAVPGPGDLL